MPPGRLRISFRFPSGGCEVRYLHVAPSVGETLTMYGKDWTVESVEAGNGHAVVMVEKRPTGAGSRMPAS